MASASRNARHVLITGPPGVGKTTLVRKCVESLQSDGIKAQGFYTEEVRHGRERIGFDVVTLDGKRGSLARSQDGEPTVGRQYTVGKYQVHLASFVTTALTTLRCQKDHPSKLFVIDEIGKMELFSQSFVQSVRDTLNKVDSTVLATIPVPKGRPIPFVEEVRNRKDAVVFNVSKANRNDIFDDIINAIKESLQVYSHG